MRLRGKGWGELRDMLCLRFIVGMGHGIPCISVGGELFPFGFKDTQGVGTTNHSRQGQLALRYRPGMLELDEAEYDLNAEFIGEDEAHDDGVAVFLGFRVDGVVGDRPIELYEVSVQQARVKSLVVDHAVTTSAASWEGRVLEKAC